MKLTGTAGDFVTATDDSTHQVIPGDWLQGSEDPSTWWWTTAPALQSPAQWAVLDTNQLLSNLEAVQCLVAHITGVNCVVPRVVVKELELLERLEQPGGSVQARVALQFVQSQLLALDGFRCGSASDRSSLVLQGEGEAVYEGLFGPRVRSKGVPPPDDHVLACVRYFAEVAAPGMTELLTSDCRLAIKAAFHGVPSENALVLMGRSLAPPSGRQGFATESPPGLSNSVITAAAANHISRTPPFSKSDDIAEKEADQKHSGCNSMLAVQISRNAWANSNYAGQQFNVRAEGAKTGMSVQHGHVASTQSPSSEDDCADPSEGLSSLDGSTFEMPPGLLLQVPRAQSSLSEGNESSEAHVQKSEENKEDDEVPEEHFDGKDNEEREDREDRHEKDVKIDERYDDGQHGEIHASQDETEEKQEKAETTEKDDHSMKDGVAGVAKSLAADARPTAGEGSRRARPTNFASVILRGLPFNVTKDDVLGFVLQAGVPLESLAQKEAVTLLANAQCRPSGFAEVRLAHGVDFRGVRARLHMQYLRGRYIEAFPSKAGRKSASKN